MRDLVRAKKDLTGDTVANVVEAAPDAVVVIGASGRIVRVNSQAKKLFGYSQEELLGQKPDLLLPRRPRRRDVQHRVGHVAHLRVRPFGHGLEVLARRRDGTEFPVEVSLSFLEVGAETLVLGAIRDIEHKRAEDLYLAAIVEASDDAINLLYQFLVGGALFGLCSMPPPPSGTFQLSRCEHQRTGT